MLDLVNIFCIAIALKLVSVGRRERDHSEAERAQHIKKIHELQEHIQDKERQLMELQEQVCFICIQWTNSIVVLMFVRKHIWLILIISFSIGLFKTPFFIRMTG